MDNLKVSFYPYIPERAFEWVADQVKQVILKKRLKPGNRLPSERTLAEQFQVGRLTIREALRTLETSGFITIKKGGRGGIFVGTGNLEALSALIKDNFFIQGITSDQMQAARIALECAAVQAAIRNATEEDLARIAHFMKETAHIMEFPDRVDEIVSRMVRFHILITGASHNPAFIIFTQAIMAWAQKRAFLASWVPSTQHKRDIWLLHRQIFEAIKTKDEERAVCMMCEEIETVGAIMREVDGAAAGLRQSA